MFRCVICGFDPEDIDKKLATKKCSKHCKTCGQPKDPYSYCSCCVECGTYPCNCSYDDDDDGEGHGSASLVPGWETRGVKVKWTMPLANWEKVYTCHNKSTDLVQSACDFYMLEAMSAGIVPGTEKLYVPVSRGSENEWSLKVRVTTFEQLLTNGKASRGRPRIADRQVIERICSGEDEERALADFRWQAHDENHYGSFACFDPENGRVRVSYDVKLLEAQSVFSASNGAEASMLEARSRFETLVEKLDESFRNYADLAIGGELRHHRCMHAEKRLPSSRSNAWVAWKQIRELAGAEALADAAKLFEDFQDSSYGGPKWAQVATFLYMRENGSLPPAMFVDRMFAAEHNGGAVFDKIDWKIANEMGWDMSYLKARVLPAHASNPPRFKTLLRGASDDTVELWNNYLEALREVLEIDIENPLTAKSKVLTVCIRCGSNAKLGHYAHCRAVQKGWVGKKLNEKYFIQKIDEEDLEEGMSMEYGYFDLAIYENTDLPYNAKGVLALSLEEEIRVWVSFGHPYTSNSKNYVLKVKDIPTTEIDILSLVPNLDLMKAPLTWGLEVRVAQWNVTIGGTGSQFVGTKTALKNLRPVKLADIVKLPQLVAV